MLYKIWVQADLQALYQYYKYVNLSYEIRLLNMNFKNSLIKIYNYYYESFIIFTVVEDVYIWFGNVNIGTSIKQFKYYF